MGLGTDIAHSPGISVNAIMPEPRMDEMPSDCAKSAASVASPATMLLTVDTDAMIISGAAEPSARKDAPATSSESFSRWHSVSSDGARCSSATTAMPTKQ